MGALAEILEPWKPLETDGSFTRIREGTSQASKEEERQRKQKSRRRECISPDHRLFFHTCRNAALAPHRNVGGSRGIKALRQDIQRWLDPQDAAAHGFFAEQEFGSDPQLMLHLKAHLLCAWAVANTREWTEDSAPRDLSKIDWRELELAAGSHAEVGRVLQLPGGYLRDLLAEMRRGENTDRNSRRTVVPTLEVPCVAVPLEGKGTLLKLVLEQLPGGQGHVYTSPRQSLVPQDRDFRRLETDVRNAVSCLLIDRGEGSFNSTDVRVEVRDLEEDHLIDQELGGSSITGAAAWGMYSLLAGRELERGVLIIASVLGDKGNLASVDSSKVAAKTAAVAAYNDAPGRRWDERFDTIVVVSEDNETAARNGIKGCTHAPRIVREEPTLAACIEVRSQWSEALIGYLKATEKALSTFPLLDRIFGTGKRQLVNDDLRVPLKAVPFDPKRDAEELREKERLREEGSEGGDEEASKRLYAFTGSPSGGGDELGTVPPEPLDDVALDAGITVACGDPGSGKTEFLRGLVRDGVRCLQKQVKGFGLRREEIPFLAFVRLPQVAAALLDKKGLKEFIAGSGCKFQGSVPTGAERAAAAVLQALESDWHFPERLVPWAWRQHTGTADTRWTDDPHPLLCLDALDEVPETTEEQLNRKESLCSCLRELAEQTPVRLVATSRIAGYTPGRLVPHEQTGEAGREWRIVPFDVEQVGTFVRRFFGKDAERGQQLLDDLRSKPTVSGMIQNPLMATLVSGCALSSANGEEALSLPARRVEVFYRTLKGMLSEDANRWVVAKRKESEADRSLVSNDPAGAEESVPAPKFRHKLRCLAAIAYHFFPDQSFTKGELDAFLGGYLKDLKSTEVGSPLVAYADKHTTVGLADLLKADGVLRPCGSGKLMFLHLCFHEILAGWHIAECVKQRGWAGQISAERGTKRVTLGVLVSRKAWDSIWEQPISLMAGVLGFNEEGGAKPDPSLLVELLDMLSDEKQDDYLRHRLALAAICVAELGVLATEEGALGHSVSQLAEAVLAVWQDNTRREAIAAAGHLPRAICALGRVNPQVSSRSPGNLDRGTGTPGMPVHRPHLQGTPTTMGFLSILVDLLTDQRECVQLGAQEALANLGSAAAIPVVLLGLVELLHYRKRGLFRGPSEWDVRCLAARVLESMGNVAATPGVLSSLVESARHAHAQVRWQAAKALGRMGNAAATPEVLSGLVGFLHDDREFVRKGGCVALGAIGRPVPEVISRLLQLLRDDVWEVRLSAAEALANVLPTPNDEDLPMEDVLLVLSVLGESMLPDPVHRSYVVDARRKAAERLVKGCSSAITSDVLPRLLREPATPARGRRGICGGHVLRAMRRTAATPVFLSGLAEVLRDRERTRLHVLRALNSMRHMGSSAATPEILASLLQCLRRWQWDAEVARGVVTALGRMGPDAATPEILSGLTEFLHSHDRSERTLLEASETMARMGRPAAVPEVLPVLLGLLRRGTTGRECWVAARVLGELGSAAATPEVLTGLSEVVATPSLYDHERSVVTMRASAAAEALGDLGRGAAKPEVLARLSGVLATADFYAPRHVEGMRRYEDDHKTRPLCAIARALGKMGGKAARSDVLASLVKCLGHWDYDRHVRAEAAKALGRMGRAAAKPSVLSGLTRVMCNPRLYASTEAAEALASMSLAATPEVLSCLRRLLEDEDSMCCVDEVAGMLADVRLGLPITLILRLTISHIVE